MTSYLDRKQSDHQIACPISLIRYPFRLQSQLQLPPGTKVKIMDLPGLAYVGDEGNANLIRQCREALCLVTYNSAETDRKKINNLLQEVVEQVKELGGSPARMLFVLNRIDVFRADNHWSESQRGFIEKTTAKIKTELKDRLREYTQEIEHLQVSKLSSWPALLALQIQSDNLNDSNQACKKADNHFNALIEEVLEDLPRKQEKWSEHDRQRVADALWEKSYAAEFEQHLSEHITQHFPQLVIPQLLDQFKTTAGNTIQEWAIQTSSAILNSSEARYQQEIENLKHIKIYVKEFIENSGKQLRNSFNNLEEKIKHCLNKKKNQNSEGVPENTISEAIQNTILEIQVITPFTTLEEQLYPLYLWHDELGKEIDKVLTEIANSVEEGKINLSDPIFNKADSHARRLLEDHLNRLVNLGYTGEIAKNGKTVKAKTNSEKERLQQLNNEFNNLPEHLNRVLKNIINSICNQAVNKIYDAVNQLFNCYLDYLQKELETTAQNLSIQFPHYQLSQVERDLKFNFDLKANFAILEKLEEERIPMMKLCRTWWSLWLIEVPVSKIQYKKFYIDNANLPSTLDLLGGWILQAKQVEIEIVNQLAEWLLRQIDDLIKNVDNVQREIVDRYEDRLKKAYQEIQLDYQVQRELPDKIRSISDQMTEKLLDISWAKINELEE